MATTLAKAIRYISDPNNLYQQFKKGSFTRDLEVMSQFSLDEAGAVRVQSNSYTGDSQAYDGYGSVSYAAADVIKANTGWVTYQLDQKRYYPMPIDKIESEESLTNFVSRINGLMKYKVAADIDTYRLSKLAHQAGVTCVNSAGTSGVIDTDVVGATANAALSKTNILPTIETMLAKMAEEEVTPESYLMYATPATLRILEDADKITRFINVRETERDGISYKIRYIETSNGRVDIVSIPGKYFHAFTLNAPASITASGTNLNVVGAVDNLFRFMIVARPAVNAVVKVNEARILPSGTVRGFLGDLFELFIYHDIFVIERHAGVGAADATTLLTPVAFNGVIKCEASA